MHLAALRRPRRTARAAAALLAVASLVATVAAAPAGAADGDGPGTPFATGDAQASADTFTLALTAANATIGFTFGRSIAQYQDRTGTAQARALDLGGLPALFGGDQCDGSAPLLQAATLPPLTRADSTDPAGPASRVTQVRQPGIGGGPVGDVVGTQDATATPLPSSRAVTGTVPIDVFLVGVTGGRTEVTTRQEGRLREAVAVSTADELRVAGGLFTFTRPRWEATARSGDRDEATGSFTFEAATVLGQPRTAEEAMGDLANFKSLLDALLQPLGVTFELPRVEARDGGVRVTPMGFHVADPPFGRDVLVPFLGQVDPLVQALRTLVVQTDCRNQVLLTVVDVLLGVVGGSGTITVAAGGADAVTTATDYTVAPIDELPAETPTQAAPSVESADLTAGTDAFGSDLGDLGGADLGDLGDLGDAGMDDLGAAPFGADLVATDPTADAAPTAATARRSAAALPPATLTSYEDASSGGAAVAVGIVALGGAVALSLADRMVGRRARRRIP